MLHPPCFSVVYVLEPQYSLLQMPWDRQQSRTLPDFSDVVLAGTGTWLLVWGSQRLQLLVSSCVFVRGGGVGWGPGSVVGQEGRDLQDWSSEVCTDPDPQFFVPN